MSKLLIKLRSTFMFLNLCHMHECHMFTRRQGYTSCENSMVTNFPAQDASIRWGTIPR